MFVKSIRTIKFSNVKSKLIETIVRELSEKKS